MKFFNFCLISLFIVISVSIKLLIVNQEKEIKNIETQISKIDLQIEKKKTDISYSTRPQILKEINSDKFKYLPIFQSDILRLEAN